jgi:hypothetical protein
VIEVADDMFDIATVGVGKRGCGSARRDGGLRLVHRDPKFAVVERQERPRAELVEMFPGVTVLEGSPGVGPPSWPASRKASDHAR